MIVTIIICVLTVAAFCLVVAIYYADKDLQRIQAADPYTTQDFGGYAAEAENGERWQECGFCCESEDVGDDDICRCPCHSQEDEK